MHGVASIIRFIAAFVVIGLIVGGWFGVNRWLDRSGLSSQPGPSLDELMNRKEAEKFQPGRREFDRALELLAIGRIDEAREKLSLIQQLYPASKVGPEAVRILGEINIDELLSLENKSNKTLHRVEPGQGYLNIMQDNDTTFGALMFLNGILERQSLHVGDEFTVMPLHHRLKIDLARNRVILQRPSDEGSSYEFVKEYPILRNNVGKIRGRVIETKVTRTHGEKNARSYRPSQSGYLHAVKIIGFEIRGRYLQIRPMPAADAEDPGRGLFLASPEMEELAMLIRVGNEVEVHPAE